MKKELILLLLISLSTVSAATIKGNIFDIDLNRQENAIIEINTVPPQKMIAEDGRYSFEVPLGKYKIKAYYKESGNIEAEYEEDIIIKDEKMYNIDLVLFPTLKEIDNNKFSNKILMIIFILLILIIFIITFLYRKKKNQPEEQEDLKKVIDVIKSHGRRTTQKDLRKELNLSEAKISLMITDLESQGKIRKIKKGRGNIIILTS